MLENAVDEVSISLGIDVSDPVISKLKKRIEKQVVSEAVLALRIPLEILLREPDREVRFAACRPVCLPSRLRVLQRS